MKYVQIENVIKGDYTRLSFELKELKILIKCIYSPYDDMNANDNENNNNKFFRKVFEDNYDDEFDIRMTVGDFNVATNTTKTLQNIYM